jgi:hypothetical protein
MSTYHQLAWLWLPLCGGLTGLGLVLSFLAMRRRGLGSGLRGASFSLLPLAAYLTGAIEMLWKIGVAIGDFATGFILSTRVWSGIAVTGLAVVLFVVSGPLRRRRVKRGRDTPAAGRGASAGTLPAAGRGTPGTLVARSPATVPANTVPANTAPANTGPAPAKPRKGKNAGDDDDDLGDVADILRRHGIT